MYIVATRTLSWVKKERTLSEAKKTKEFWEKTTGLKQVFIYKRENL